MQSFAAIINQSLTEALKVVEDSCVACVLNLLQQNMFELRKRSNFLSLESQVGGESPTGTPHQVLARRHPSFWALGALLPVGRV
jgi:hypothetical protein